MNLLIVPSLVKGLRYGCCSFSFNSLILGLTIFNIISLDIFLTSATLDFKILIVDWITPFWNRLFYNSSGRFSESEKSGEIWLSLILSIDKELSKSILNSTKSVYSIIFLLTFELYLINDSRI